MKYMGSKRRLVKYLKPILSKYRVKGQTHVEPFVGGANMINELPNPRIGGDYNNFTIRALTAIRDEPHRVPKTMYEYTKDMHNANRANLESLTNIELLLLYGCSFSGMFAGTWARDIGGRDYVSQTRNNAIKQSAFLKGVELFNCSYQDLKIPPKSIIYCDPPYFGTAGYTMVDFNTAKFWKWCDAMVKKGHIVYVSEYRAPPHWKCIFAKRLANTVSNKGSSVAVEKLFVNRAQFKILEKDGHL